MGDNEEIVLTPAGYEELAGQLENLRTTERRDVAERIRDAITYGELTENSEYEDAKNAQAFLEGRIEDLKVPRDRAGAFHTQVFERYARYEPEVAVGKIINSPLPTHNIASSLSLIRMAVPFFPDAYPCPNSQLTSKLA